MAKTSLYREHNEYMILALEIVIPWKEQVEPWQKRSSDGMAPESADK